MLYIVHSIVCLLVYLISGGQKNCIHESPNPFLDAILTLALIVCVTIVELNK